jgi:hypothetical protein
METYKTWNICCLDLHREKLCQLCFTGRVGEGWLSLNLIAQVNFMQHQGICLLSNQTCTFRLRSNSVKTSKHVIIQLAEKEGKSQESGYKMKENCRNSTKSNLFNIFYMKIDQMTSICRILYNFIWVSLLVSQSYRRIQW